ncbi:thiolase family protein [Desulfococcaceae bacterium OttesenSCG-928-F15]|nr:thiolase family protein [Desulfococcaceae bacterium OttesenSCG-928-F15]
MSKAGAKEVVIVGMARTPIGDFLGSLSSLSAVELANIAAKAAMERAGVKPEQIDEVTAGMVYKDGAKGNPARQIQIAMGIPVKAAAVTVEQQCASSMRALEVACNQIQLGKTKAALVCGLESMSNIPYLLMKARTGYRMGPGQLEDGLFYDALVDVFSNQHIGMTAERVADLYKISREEQDAMALMSQDRASKAIEKGFFKEEIVPVEIKTRKGTVIVDRDEHPRATTMEALGALRPAFKKDGSVTAGNASGINDGACAAVIMSAERAAELGITPLVKILSTTSYGCAPEIMGIGPIYAIPQAIEEAGLKASDIEYYEINEAFAAQAAACIKELKLDMAYVNGNGSGIALGHPVGMTSLRLVISGYYEMKRRGVRYGCASLCAGGGPAMAVVFERLS